MEPFTYEDMMRRQTVLDLYLTYVAAMNKALVNAGSGPFIPTFNQMGQMLDKLDAFVEKGELPSDD